MESTSGFLKQKQQKRENNNYPKDNKRWKGI